MTKQNILKLTLTCLLTSTMYANESRYTDGFYLVGSFDFSDTTTNNVGLGLEYLF